MRVRMSGSRPVASFRFKLAQSSHCPILRTNFNDIPADIHLAQALRPCVHLFYRGDSVRLCDHSTSKRPPSSLPRRGEPRARNPRGNAARTSMPNVHATSAASHTTARFENGAPKPTTISGLARKSIGANGRYAWSVDESYSDSLPVTGGD